MIVDAHQLADGSELETDICIIGGGAVGIAIARALQGSQRRIVVLEAGGTDLEPETQALYEGEQTGQRYYDLDVTRLRYLGGSTNHWGNQVAPFDAIDFERRPWIPYSGWPITRADLDPYYRRASEFLDLGPYDFDQPAAWHRDQPDYQIHRFADPRVVNKLFRRRTPRLAVGEFYRDDLERQANLRLVLHANVTRIGLAGDGGAVDAVDVATLEGRRLSVRARDYVVAAGGIENARLLLASRDVVNVGIGNRHDLLGRFFMDHLGVHAGTVLPARGISFRAYANHAPKLDHWSAICLSAAAQRALEIAVYRLKFELRVAGKDTRGYGGLRSLREGLLGGAAARELDRAIADVFLHPEGLVEGLRHRIMGTGVLAECLNVLEPVPDPDSRITLSDSVDALGMPQPRLHWRLSNRERDTLRHGQELVGGVLAMSGLGRLRVEPALLETDWSVPGFVTEHMDLLSFGNHHTGTTRMGETPRDGVVDRDGKVFGVANLYVAGSSTFPTVGSANPTLTVCAMALRLADHLDS